MAMTTCKECEKPVSTGAKTCPHCGTSAPSKKKKKGGIGKWLLILMALGFVAALLPKNEKAIARAPVAQPVTAPAPVTAKEAKVLAPECKVTKKDGTLDARECDLEELCKDWVFYRGKTLKYSSEGEQSKLADAQRSFNKTNVWLSAYREKDVSGCLQRNGG